MSNIETANDVIHEATNLLKRENDGELIKLLDHIRYMGLGGDTSRVLSAMVQEMIDTIRRLL